MGFCCSAVLGQAEPELVLSRIAPAATDPDIDDWLEDHFAFRLPGGGTKQRLFVHLAGSFGQPERSQLILKEAAAAGYHAIGLRYPNRWTVANLCNGVSDVTCHEAVRLEILFGTDTGPRVNVSRANSLENRLAALLALLAEDFPQEGWDAFLTDGTVSWSKVVASGHSQGGGHAALLGRERRLAGVIMFGAPADFSRALGQVAPWLSAPKATPPDLYFGFCHQEDGLSRKEEAWRALGLGAFGDVVSVDGSAAPPFASSRMLTTAIPPARPGREHGSVVVDAATPRAAGGEPVFSSVWRFILEQLGSEAPPSGEPNEGVPLQLRGERFKISASWHRPDGSTGGGTGARLTTDSGVFWFFRPENVEIVVKVLDGCRSNGHLWVLAGGLTNVEVNMVVEDQSTGDQRRYFNPPGTAFQPIQDTTAFATCP